jgi:uncharacterized protein
MEEPISGVITCSKCQTEIFITSRFCSKCGKLVKGSKSLDESNREYEYYLYPILAYYFLSIAVIGVFSFGSFIPETLEFFLWFDVSYSLFTLGFTIFFYKDMLPLFSFKNVNLKPLLVLLGIELIIAPIIYLMAGWINMTLWGQDVVITQLFWGTSYPFLWCIISIAIQPAIFEEFAFRGFIFSGILKISNIKAAIWVSAFLFAILHLSAISMFWLLPIGLLFGYYRGKYHTLWYGIIGHFFYNSLIVIFEFIEYKL